MLIEMPEKKYYGIIRGLDYDLGDLYRAVEAAGGELNVGPTYREDKPPYIAVIEGSCGPSISAYGDSYESAALAVINAVNEGSAK